jgi:signal transduction histidine kinase
VAIAGVATAAVVIFALPLGVVIARADRDRALLRLQRDTVATTRAIDLGPVGRDPVELPRSADVLGAYDRAGVRVAGRGPARADAAVRDAVASGTITDRAAGGVLVAAVPLVVSERVVGAVRAARSDAAVSAQVHHAWLALGALAAALGLGAWVAALLLGRRLARPLERLALTAQRLGDGDFSVRAQPAAIPEVDAVGAALGTTAERLDDLLARERAFSADASHQLRTPLAALRLELEALELRAGGADPELVAALAQVERLQGTVGTLLAVARDAPRQSGPADLRALAAGVEERWRGPLAAAGRPLRTVLRSDQALAAAAPPVLAEIVDVLVDNARRHGAGAVTLAIRDAATGVAIDVGDEGTGFAGDPEAAFARRPAGTSHGIGLALARSLAEAEGGRLAVSRATPPVVTLLLPTAGA